MIREILHARSVRVFFPISCHFPILPPHFRSFRSLSSFSSFLLLFLFCFSFSTIFLSFSHFFYPYIAFFHFSHFTYFPVFSISLHFYPKKKEKGWVNVKIRSPSATINHCSTVRDHLLATTIKLRRQGCNFDQKVRDKPPYSGPKA